MILRLFNRLISQYLGRILFGWALLFNSVSISFSDTLIIESSDQHANYPELAHFFEHINLLADEFKNRDPNGKLILLVNGDYSGSSIWSHSDRGNLAYKALIELQKRFQVIFVPGNHDAFDWGGRGGGNQLFVDQLGSLKKSGGSVIAANLVPGDAGKFFSRHYDIRNPGQEKIRVIGLALENLFQECNYDVRGKVQPISAQIPSILAITRELRQAKRDGVKKVVFAFHEGSIRTKEILAQVRPIAQSMGIEIPLVFAAHDHITLNEKVDGVQILNGGADFSFSVAEIQNDGNVNAKLVSAREEFSGRPINPNPEIIQDIMKYVEKVNIEEGQVIGTTLAYPEIRADLVLRRSRLGNVLADTLVDWATARLKLKPGNSDVQVVGLYNSSSYRGNSGIPDGSFTLGQARALYPYANDTHVYYVTGKQIEETEKTIRKYGLKKNSFTPQLSSNLRLNQVEKLEIKNDQGNWEAVDPGKKYGLVMDAWLSENGFKIPELEWLNNPANIVDSQLHQEVMVQFAPKRFSEPREFSSQEYFFSNRCAEEVKAALIRMTAQ